MECINISHPDVVKLSKELNISPTIIGAKIGVWQKQNNIFDRFPTKAELFSIKSNINPFNLIKNSGYFSLYKGKTYIKQHFYPQAVNLIGKINSDFPNLISIEKVNNHFGKGGRIIYSIKINNQLNMPLSEIGDNEYTNNFDSFYQDYLKSNDVSSYYPGENIDDLFPDNNIENPVSPQELLTNLSKNVNNSSVKFLSDLFLRNLVKNPTLTIELSHPDNMQMNSGPNTQGEWYSHNNSIKINKLYATNTTRESLSFTILHEILHSFTAYPWYKKNLTGEEKLFKYEVEELYNDLKLLLETKDNNIQYNPNHPAYSNPKEFITYMVTNKKFREFINSLEGSYPIGQLNIWQRFINAVCKLLGINSYYQLAQKQISGKEISKNLISKVTQFVENGPHIHPENPVLFTGIEDEENIPNEEFPIFDNEFNFDDAIDAEGEYYENTFIPAETKTDLDQNISKYVPTEKEIKLAEQQIVSYNNLVKQLRQLQGADSKKRVELKVRISHIKSSIFRLLNNKTYDTIISVAGQRLTQASKLINRNSGDKDDLREAYKIIKDTESFDKDISDGNLNSEQLEKVKNIRARVNELSVKIKPQLISYFSKLAKQKGFNFEEKDFTNPTKDIKWFTNNLLSLEESHIEESRIAGQILNDIRNTVRLQLLDFKNDLKAIRIKFPNMGEEFKKLIDSNRKLITKVKSEYFQIEKEINKEAEELLDTIPVNDFESRQNVIMARNKWYKDNHDWELTDKGIELYEAELKSKFELETDENGKFYDEEAEKRFLSWELANSPYKGLNYIGKSFTDENGEVLSNGNGYFTRGNYKWYRFLKKTPKAKWDNKQYDNIKDNELYNYITNTIEKCFKLVPHRLFVDMDSMDKLFNSIVFDLTNTTDFTVKNFLSGIRDEFLDAFSHKITQEDLSEREGGIQDASGRTVPKFKVPKLSDIENFKDPGELLEKFFELAVSYSHMVDNLPSLELLEQNLASRGMLKTNPKTGIGFKSIFKKNNEVKDGLVNAVEQLRYAMLSQVYGISKTDEEKVELDDKEKQKLNTYHLISDKSKTITKEEYDKLSLENKKLYENTESVRKLSKVKTGDTLINWTRRKLLSLNAPAGVVNMTVGYLSNYTWAARDKDFSDKDLNKANSMIFGSVLRFWSKKKISTPESLKIALLADYFGIENHLIEDSGLMSKLDKFLLSFQSGGEYLVHTSGLIAKMLKTKVLDKNNKEHSLYSAFKVINKQGIDTLVWDKENFGDSPEWNNVEFLDNNGNNISKLNNFFNELKNYRKQTQGDYMNNLKAKEKVAGRMLMLFRTWLPQAIESRFGSEREGFKGRYRSYGTLYNTFNGNIGSLNLGIFGKSIKTGLFLGYQQLLRLPLISRFGGKKAAYDILRSRIGDNNMIDVENMLANQRELKIILCMTMMFWLLSSIGDDDKHRQKISNIMYNITLRSYQDLTFFYSPTNASNILRDAIPVYSTLKDINETLSATVNAIEGHDTYQRGFRKGHSKFLKEFEDNFPITHSYQSVMSSLNQAYGGLSYSSNNQ